MNRLMAELGPINDGGAGIPAGCATLWRRCAKKPRALGSRGFFAPVGRAERQRVQRNLRRCVDPAR